MPADIQKPATGKFKFKRVSGGTLLIACDALAKAVYLAQTENAELKTKALEISPRPGLEFEYRYRDLGVFIENIQ